MADTLERFVPALSATSDAPDQVAAEPQSAPALAEAPAAKVEKVAATETVADKSVDTSAAEKVVASEAETPEAHSVETEGGAPEGPVAETPVHVEDKGPKGVGKALEAQRQALAAERARAAAAEQRAAEAIRAMEALAARLPQPQAVEEPKDLRPSRDAFDMPEAYDTALVEWSGRQAARAVKAELETQATQERAAAERKAAEAANATATQEAALAWNERKAKAAEKYPDFEEVTTVDDLPITQVMADSIIHADNGPDVAYHLGKHPKEAERISRLAPGRQIFEIARLSEKLTVAPKTNVTKAPDPIRPHRPSSAPANQKSTEDMSMDEYAAHRQAALKAAARRPGALH